jgi:cytochrome c biogenesis protein CcdA
MRARRFLSAALLFLVLCPSVLAAPAPRLAISPPEWRFGWVRQGEKIQLAVTVTSKEPRALNVTFVPTCDCLSVEPASQPVPPGGQAVFVLHYDSSDDTGNIRRGFIVTTDLPGASRIPYMIYGTIRQERTQVEQGGASWTQVPAAGSLAISYFYTPGCRSCEEFLSVEIPRLSRTLGLAIEVDRKDLLDPAVFEQLTREAAARGLAFTAAPVLLAGDTLLMGDREIRARLSGVLATLAAEQQSAAGQPRAAAPASGTAAISLPEKLALLPVIAAGLIDGINPCAFTTLIFLLASLALAGRGRREVLLIGALFSAAVFLTYFLIGLGFFAALRAANAVPLISMVLRWVLVAVLAVFAGLSVYDYTRIRAGRPAEILLQLPTALKKRIHTSIRSRVRTAALAGSSLVLGFLVSIFEFACTGQVYLPTLAWLVRVQRRPFAVLLLALYNLCFILPLLVVFAGSYWGVSSARITAGFQKHMGKVKLGLAAVFVGLAVFTLVG